MISSTVLDFVILISFIYFTGSLLLTSVNEAIAGFFRLRPKQLQIALENLFFDEGWRKFVNGTLIKSPHLQALMKKEGTYPSYIPAKSFVMAIISELGSANYTPANLQNAISGSDLPDGVKLTLTDLANKAGNKLKTFESSLAQFYNNAMDRAGGVYKKKIRLILIFLAFIISVALNLDTINIAQRALGNKAKLNQAVDRIVSQLPNIRVNRDSIATIAIDTKDGTITVGQSKLRKDTTKALSAIGDNAKAIVKLDHYLQDNSDFSLGYANADEFSHKWIHARPGDWFLALLGVLITTFALQISSNFWFDLMNKVVNLRASGQKPDTGKKSKNNK